MILTKETRNTRRKTGPSTTLTNTNLTLNGQRLEPGLQDENPDTNLDGIYRFSSYVTENKE